MLQVAIGAALYCQIDERMHHMFSPVFVDNMDFSENLN